MQRLINDGVLETREHKVRITNLFFERWKDEVAFRGVEKPHLTESGLFMEALEHTLDSFADTQTFMTVDEIAERKKLVFALFRLSRS